MPDDWPDYPQAMDMIATAFPENSTFLQKALDVSVALDANVPRIQRSVLKALAISLSDNVADLKQSCLHPRLARHAWLARNILEIGVWIPFCAKSVQNAQTFKDDVARDFAQDLAASMSQTFDPFIREPLEEAYSFVVQRAAELGIDDLDSAFLRSSHAASQIGEAQFFRDYNKIFSKYAHPTAVSIMLRAEADPNDINIRNFARLGAIFAMRGLLRLRDFCLERKIIHMGTPPDNLTEMLATLSKRGVQPS